VVSFIFPVPDFSFTNYDGVVLDDFLITCVLFVGPALTLLDHLSVPATRGSDGGDGVAGGGGIAPGGRDSVVSSGGWG